MSKAKEERGILALDTLDRAENLRKRGMWKNADGEYRVALECPGALPAESRLAAAWGLCHCLYAVGRFQEAAQTASEVLQNNPLSPKLVALFGTFAALEPMICGDLEKAEEASGECIRALRSAGEGEPLAVALRIHGHLCLRMGRLGRAYESVYAALATSRHDGFLPGVASACNLLSFVHMAASDYAASIRAAREGLEIATECGHPTGIARNNLQLAISLRYSGRLQESLACSIRAVTVGEEMGAKELVASGRIAAGRSLRELGRLDSAREMTESALEVSPFGEGGRNSVLIRQDLGDLELLAGNTTKALEHFRAAWTKGGEIAPTGDLVDALAWRIGLCLVEIGDLAGGRKRIDHAIQLAEGIGNRKERALALRARSVYHMKGGDLGEARRDLEECFRLFDLCPVPHEKGRTHLAFERLMRELGPKTAETLWLRGHHIDQARKLFEETGAQHNLGTCGDAAMALIAEHDKQGVAPQVLPERRKRDPGIFSSGWKSAGFVKALDECRLLGPTSLPILLTGETGSGKTFLAEALHDLGRGIEGSFFPVNCATLPQHLQESELFGHRKGAFTGADRDHPGIIREARRGTVFLDEIDKTTLEFQAKLLHVLDELEIRPVGSPRRIAVEARFVCATNRHLPTLIERGEFLEDLFQRLRGGVIQIPPLRARREDIPHLIDVLLRAVCAIENAPVPSVTDDAMRLLLVHSWPGNVRELKSLLHRVVALNRGTAVLDAPLIRRSAPPDSLLRESGPEPITEPPPPQEYARPSPPLPLDDDAGLSARLEEVERQAILRAFEEAGGVRKRAAEILDVSYRGLGKKMVRLGIPGPRALRSRRS